MCKPKLCIECEYCVDFPANSRVEGINFKGDYVYFCDHPGNEGLIADVCDQEEDFPLPENCPYDKNSKKLESNSIEEAYFDRNQLAMLCAKMAQTLGWDVRVNPEDEEWPIILINLPTGQISYHIPVNEMRGEYEIDWEGTFWDGHFLNEKRESIQKYLLKDIPPENPRIFCTQDNKNYVKEQLKKWKEYK
jgi:hypothetical protein